MNLPRYISSALAGVFLLTAFYCLHAADFRIDDVRWQNGRAEVSFAKEPAFYYILWQGEQPTEIQLVTDLALGSTAPNFLADTNATNASRFYRVEKVPMTSLRDTDGDGINDAWELLYRHPGAALNPSDVNEDHTGNGVADSIDALRESLRMGAVRGRPVLAAGTYHTLAIKTDGTLWGWGDNFYGELGSIGFSETSTPVQIGVDTNWLVVSINGTTSYGLKTDGTLWTWGQSADNVLFVPSQIGTNSDWISAPNGSPYLFPAESPPISQTPTALRADGTSWQLMGRTTNAEPYDTTNGWSAIADDPSDVHWGIKQDGTLWKGFSVFDTNPVWTSISLGVSHALALQTNGTLWAWVSSFHNPDVEGQLGTAVFPPPTVPTQVGTDKWAAVAAGAYHSVGIKSDGSLWWWGVNHGFDPNNSFLISGSGQAGTNRPTRFGTGNDWMAIAAGASHTVALRADGTIWTFGFNELGKLGNGTVALVNKPTQVGTDQDWKTVAPGVLSSFALKTNGTLWAWGKNQHGAQGVGNFDHDYTPRQVQGSNWIAISGGDRHTIGLQSDGSLWVWGRYTYTNFNDLITNAPMRLGLDADWAMISAGFNHSLALKTDGSIWAWGRNPGLGNNNAFSFTDYPTRIGSSFSWTDISAGDRSSLAINSSSLWGWGISVGTSSGGPPFPQQYFGQSNLKRVANSKKHILRSHALALKVDGTLFSWGRNLKGQLGNGGNSDTLSLGQVGIATNWSQIAVGDMFSNALQQDGTFWSSGFNFYGQLGLGTRTDTNVFTRVGLQTNWIAVASGFQHTLALTADGSLWAWGDNSYGQCAQPASFEPAPVAGTNWGKPH